MLHKNVLAPCAGVNAALKALTWSDDWPKFHEFDAPPSVVNSESILQPTSSASPFASLMFLPWLAYKPPGGSLTPSQLFFISYANVWCSAPNTPTVRSREDPAERFSALAFIFKTKKMK